VTQVKNISPYMVEGPDTVIINRTTPLCQAPEIKFGNQPIDGGHLLLTKDERDCILNETSELSPFIRLFLGAEEFLNGKERWCLWLKDSPPSLLRQSPMVMNRIQDVRSFRLLSKRAETKRLAETPTQFAFISHTDDPYLLIPSVSSERRKFIPIGFMPPETIASNLNLVIPNATLYHFGVLTSTMHMAWVRQVCGRLESRYRYSNKLVYNNFPWPQLDVAQLDGVTPSNHASCVREAAARSYWTSYHEGNAEEEAKAREKHKAGLLKGDAKKVADVEAKAQAVLDVREKYPSSTLADLYDPLTMPPDLVKAHADLDRAVDRCYRSAPFTSDRQRVEFLFALYESLTAPLLPMEKKERTR